MIENANANAGSSATIQHPPVNFPQYERPGIKVADPKFGKPLFKLMRMMMKPKIKRLTRTVKHVKKKKVKFY